MLIGMKEVEENTKTEILPNCQCILITGVSLSQVRGENSTIGSKNFIKFHLRLFLPTLREMWKIERNCDRQLLPLDVYNIDSVHI